MHEPTRLSGPDFLASVANANLANGLDVNAAEFNTRAREWREAEARNEELEIRVAQLERELRDRHEAARVVAELKTHLQAANDALAGTTTTAATAA